MQHQLAPTLEVTHDLNKLKSTAINPLECKSQSLEADMKGKPEASIVYYS